MTASGGSLEDCYTNVFVLTELHGLKWKCLTTVSNFGQQSNFKDSIEKDLVLNAYSKCLNQSLLCTWRRKPRSNGDNDAIFDNPAPTLASQKELWIFWYLQEEPKYIALLKETGLIEANDYDGFDVNYETRILFFKALHNVIERNLLKNGYIRFGKWFTKPLDMPAVDYERTLPKYINAINFHFFMHGENHVCVTVNVQRQPTLVRLSSRHFETNKCQSVILGPWSIRAILLPNQPFLQNTINGKFESPQKTNDHMSIFSVSEESDSCDFSEVQAAVSQQWSDWKKFQALPFDDDEEALGNDECNNNVPKMVLVEINNIKMFYPSCYVAILAEKMIFQKNMSSANRCDKNFTQNSSTSTGATNLKVPQNEELDLSFGTLSETNQLPNTSTLCAEDYEVAEIMNPKTNTQKKLDKFKDVFRNCKKSFAGVRAARRSFENGALSVLLSTNCINRRIDLLSGEMSLTVSNQLINSNNPMSIHSTGQIEEDTRWNFFDYLRREYCYCKMCSSSNSTNNESENASSQLTIDINKDTNVFHRSPTVLESVTPDNSPTFVEELNALQMSSEFEGMSSASSSTSETEPIRNMWSVGVPTRPDLISGRLDCESGLSSSIDSNILKILPHNRLFLSTENLLPPRVITPFVSITSITPEREDDFDEEGKIFRSNEKLDSNWQQKIKNFDYSYNPLKLDCISKKSYHIDYNQQKKRNIGPPIENDILKAPKVIRSNLATDDVVFTAPTKTKSQKSNEQQTSILKSLLDDGPISPLPTKNDNLSTNDINGNSVNHHSYLQQTNIEKQNLTIKESNIDKKKSELEKVVSLMQYNVELPHITDLWAGTVNYEEPLIKSEFESDEESDFFEQNSINCQMMSLSLLNDSIILQKKCKNKINNSNDDKNLVLTTAITTSIEEKMDTDDAAIDAMTAVTPPALLCQSDDFFLDSQKQQENNLINDNKNLLNKRKSPTLSGSRPFGIFPDYKNIHFPSSSMHMPPDQMHILSPPASNERVEFLSNNNITTTSSISVNAQPTLFSALSSSVSGIHDSLSIIYPTPPTPMQQSSPQNINVNTAQIFSTDYPLHHSATEPILLQNLCNTSPQKILRQTSIPNVSLFENVNIQEFPPSECFSGDLLDNSIDIAQRVKYASISSSSSGYSTSSYSSLSNINRNNEQRENLRLALEGRALRDYVDCPPVYKKTLREKILRYGLSDGIDTDRRLAMTLEKSEEKLLLHTYARGGNNMFMPQMSMYQMQKQNLMMQSSQNYMNQNQMMDGYGQFSGGMTGNFTNQMIMMGRNAGNNVSQNFMPNSKMMNLHNQQQLMQQQMIQNNQMTQKQGLMQQSPNYVNNNLQQMQMLQKFSNKVADQSNNPGMFGKPNSQQNMSFFQRQQFQPNMSNRSLMAQPQQQLINCFNNSNQVLNIQQSKMSATTPTPGKNFELPFGSPNNSLNSQKQTVPNCNEQNLSLPFSIQKSSTVNKNILANVSHYKALLEILQNNQACIIAVLLKDTILDLHYDSVFDAAAICCCNANIRTFELGFYINATEDVQRSNEIQRKQQHNPHFMTNYWNGFRVRETQNKCSCGFSAVRHRYLCSNTAGLFPDDSIEACGLRHTSSSPLTNQIFWFNPSVTADLQLIDLLRTQCLTRDFAAFIQNSFYLGNFTEPLIEFQKIGFDVTQPSDYIISRVDSVELDKIMSTVISSTAMKQGKNNLSKDTKTQHSNVYHPWGVQLTNIIREPKDTEYIAVIREIQPILENSIKEARGIKSQSFANTKKLEGPLTWRSFLLKTSKAHTQQQEDEMCQMEPIPSIIVAAEREAVTTNPQLINMWEKLSLAPYDQTKDVLYLAVVPDSNVVVEKCRIYLEELSSVYDKCRFGYHVQAHVKDGPRDGIIRLNHRLSNNATNTSNDNFYTDDRKIMMAKLKGFTENMENELLQFFKNNDSIFDRRAFHESVIRHKIHQNYTSLATSSDSNSMPPPAIPIQSPSSVLSSASGPLSANATLSSAGLMQMSHSSISPTQLPQNQQQPSPAAGPNSAPSASNVGTNNDDSLLDTHYSSTPSMQTQQHQQTLEAEIEKNVAVELSTEDPCYLPHVLVIYLINPFSFGSNSHHSVFARMATMALLRSYNSFLYQINVRRRPQLQLEIINLQSLYDYTAFVADPLREDLQAIEILEKSNRDKMSARDCLRKIAFTVYSQIRILLPEHTRGAMTKSMTRFGPASSFIDILDNLKQKPVLKFFKVPSSPYILAPTKTIGVFTSKDGAVLNPTNNIPSNSKLQLVSSEERVLFVSYCLINDEWLCGAVTDEQGHLLDNVLINLVAVQPPATQKDNMSTWNYVNNTQIFDAINRLWQYIKSVLVTDIRNWRLVIGKIGKIGHGELKAWTETISKKNLRLYNNTLKKQEGVEGTNGCKSCLLIPGYQEKPAIVSACLVSTEPELHLRIFPSSATSDGNLNSFGQTGFSSSSSKSTKSKSPQGSAATLTVADDPSITHIIVFPTIMDISFEQHLGQSNQDDNDFDNFFSNETDDKMEDGLGELMNSMIGDELTKNDEDVIIDNQPMATGYYISTAPALDLPDWFWSPCPSARCRLPVHLKNSLHIHTGNIQQSDEIATLGNKGGAGCAVDAHHSLDSTATDEVLKYVLEKYNALSWMNVDFATGARQSCLPIHVQALLRLQKTLTTLFS